MANTAKVQVEGGRNLRRTLKQANGDLEEMKAAHAAVSSYVARLAQSSSPRKTGALAGSHRGNSAAGSAVVRAGGARVPYAVFVHYGTTKMSARPWVSDTAQASEPRWMSMYEDHVERALDQVKGI